jgi:hypothetical protein
MSDPRTARKSAGEISESQVDSIDVSHDKSPCTLFQKIESADPSHFSKEDAIETYNRELETLAMKHRIDVGTLIDRSNTSAGCYNADFERALSLAKRIAYLKHA